MSLPARSGLFAVAGLIAGVGATQAGPLDGKSYIIQLSSTQYDSGYGRYLLPPLAAEMKASGLSARNGPGADVVVNVETASDEGRWIGKGETRAWMYTVNVTVGISPESYDIPYDGTPQFGVRASLLTPDSDREDELTCLIRLAAQTALAQYRPKGILQIDGGSCLRR